MPTPAQRFRRAAGFVRRNVHVGRPPVSDRSARWSVIAPAASADAQLVRIGLAAAERAQHLDLEAVAARAQDSDEASWVRQWPGEHYRLLAALIDCLSAKNVVEVGTFTGLSALAMLTALPADGRLTTFDIIPWADIDGTALRNDDFGGRLVQHLGDLSDVATFAVHRDLLTSADLIFIDGPKNGRFEAGLLSLLLPALQGGHTTVVLDDIRFLEMADVWESIREPKLDLTSFGHWSGTGVVAPR
ncbi:MAG TPA: class I SAM-dependent methyltransferase [Acidimicrobiales bacterium]|nr:class I SAM-dependent methyltransferase [Acidimicrobiales bacterium]